MAVPFFAGASAYCFRFSCEQPNPVAASLALALKIAREDDAATRRKTDEETKRQVRLEEAREAVRQDHIARMKKIDEA